MFYQGSQISQTCNNSPSKAFQQFPMGNLYTLPFILPIETLYSYHNAKQTGNKIFQTKESVLSYICLGEKKIPGVKSFIFSPGEEGRKELPNGVSLSWLVKATQMFFFFLSTFPPAIVFVYQPKC